MNDPHDVTGAGRMLAIGSIAYSLSVEATITNSPIFPYPVALERAFRAYDPGLTFRQADDDRTVLRRSSPDWTFRRVQFPALEVDMRRAVQLVAGLAGCAGPMMFECFVRGKRATFSLGARPQDIGFVMGHLLAVYPEAVITATVDPRQDVKDVAVLFDLYSAEPYHRALRSAHDSLWRHVAHVCDLLGSRDDFFYEVQFCRAHHPWQRNMANMLDAERSLGHRAPLGRTITHKQLDEPLFAASIRMGASTDRIARAIAAFTGSYTVDGRALRYRTLDEYTRVLGHGGVMKMLRGRATHAVGQLLTASELALFVQPPDQSAASVINLDLISGLPVPERLTGNGIPLGRNTARGIPIDVVQPLGQRNRSSWLIGRSRSGKSSALVHRCRFLAEQGHGFCLLDAHRTTAFEVVGALHGIDPAGIIFLDFDAGMPVAYNPVSHPYPEEYGRLTTEYLHSFKHLFGTDSFHRTNHLLGNAIYACLVLPDANLATIPLLFTKTPIGEQLRRRVIASVQNPAVRRFWQDEFPSYRPDAFAPISNRFSAFLLDDQTGRTFTQDQNVVDIAQWMDDGRAVIIAPPQSIEAAGIVGGCLIAQAKQAAFRRTGTPRAHRHFHFIVDEWHRFITSATTIEQILNETGKGGLSVALANQETGQIPSDLLKAVFTVPNTFVFGVGHPDARLLAPLFNGRVTPETLASQETGSVYARIDGDIVNFHTPTPLQPNAAVADRIIAHSLATYHAQPKTNVQPHTRRIINTLE